MPARPRKSKLYTRTGDRGETGLFGGRRVPKDHPRVVAYGTIDELNSALGVAVSFIRQRALAATIQSIQNELFDIGAELASEQPVRRTAKQAGVFELGPKHVRRLERLIDQYDAKVPALTTFVLPGGGQAASFLHLARTICRRTEREVVTLRRTQRVNEQVLVYLNRLCDLLFVLARYANKAGRAREITWQKDG
jgi:cob(I)alamin adenosyltransferase